MEIQELERLLNDNKREIRLHHLKSFFDVQKVPLLDFPLAEEVNNHVHTIYSFSPYSPTLAAFLARKAGLRAVGSVDHDSIAAAEEMLEAAAIIGMGSTVGCELRLSFSGTPLEGRKLNNPNSDGVGYVVMHGFPRNRIDDVNHYLKPIREQRNRRNRCQVDILNRILKDKGEAEISFDKDVLPLSCALEGGSVTERHILFSLSKRMTEEHGKGTRLLGFLKDRFDVEAEGKVKGFLEDEDNPYYLYDLLGLFKSSLLPQIFIQPNADECMPVVNAVKFFNEIGAVPAYAYLGDITESATGDKKAEKFEDDILDLLFPSLVDMGFKALTYMPPRNTKEQLLRIQEYCRHFNLMEISGVDINSPRQSFNCPEILDPEFKHLFHTTWALIAHEKITAFDPQLNIFSPSNPLAGKSLAERIDVYAKAGKGIDPHNPWELSHIVSKLLL